jgi:hypothetical protein
MKAIQFLHKALSILLVVLSCIILAIGIIMTPTDTNWFILIVIGAVGMALVLILKPEK